MNYQKEYYKELLILKKTKDFLLEELYNKSKTSPEKYNYDELKNKLDELNTLFELNRFARTISKENDDKKLFHRHLMYIQHGALYAFCEYIADKPIGSSFLDNLGDSKTCYSSNDSYISSPDAIDEIIDQLSQAEVDHREYVLENIFKEHIYKASNQLSHCQHRDYFLIKDSPDAKNDIEIIDCQSLNPELPRQVLEARVYLFNRFLADLIKEVYLLFRIDIVELLTRGNNNKLAEILNVGNMTLERFENIKLSIMNREKGIINDNDLDSTIEENITKTPKIAKLTEDRLALTQDQIIMLFKNLRDKRAINSATTDKMLGHCIALLNGFKIGDGIRQNFQKYDEIVNKETNRTAVIAVLNSIIDLLKKTG